MADDSVQVKFGAQIDGLVAGIESVKASISSITAPINSVVSAFSEMKEVLIAAFAIDQASEFVDRITEIGEQILRGTQMTGLSAQEFQTLQYAMKVTGGEAGNLGITIDRLERNIALARGGSGQAVQAFQTLGVTMDDLKTKTPYQIIQQIADGFHNLKDPILAAAAATEVGSRGFAQMLPALKAGSEGLKEFGETFRDTGAYLNDAQAGAFAATHESLVQLQTSVEGTGVQLVRLLRPAIDLTVTALTELVQWLNKVIGGLADMVQILEGTVLLGFAKCIEEVEKFGVEANLVVEKLEAAWQALGRIITDVAHGAIGQASTEWQVAQEQMDAATKKAEASLASYGKQYDDLRTKIAQATGALTNFWSSLGEKSGAAGGGGSLTTGKRKDEATEIALDQIKTQEQLAKIGLQTQKDVLDQEVAAQQISKAQEYATLQEYAQLEYQVEADALDKKLELYQDDEVKYQETLNQKAVLDAQFSQQLQKLAAQQAQAQTEELKKTEAEYKSFFDTIDRDMDSMLKGVLQGTQTWQQAMAKFFDNMAVSFIEAVAKMMVKWVAFEAVQAAAPGSGAANALGAMVPSAIGGTGGGLLGGAAGGAANSATQALTSAITGNTASTVSNTGGILQEVQSGLQWIAQTLGLTTSTVAQTTASTAAATASTASATATTGLIPAITANIAALSANTTALFASKAVPSFEVGTWSAPGGLSMLHPGEIVLPPSVSAGVRAGTTSIGAASAGGAGGGQFTINVNAIDTQTGANFLKQNASVIASAISGQMRNFNPSLRPS